MANKGMTPVMRQFQDLKKKHPYAVLLFRRGDFYETYDEDAQTCANVLGITPLKRGKDGYMAGFPHHALDTYLPKIIRAGYRVAICDQLEDPKLTKKLVKRGVLTTDATENNNDNFNDNETMKLTINNKKNESANVANNAQVSNAIEPIKVATGSVPMTPEAFLAEREDIVDADFEEVKEEVTQKAQKSSPKKKSAPKSEAPAPVWPKVQFSTYKTKKGDTAPQIIGFAGEDDPRWKSHKDAGHKYVSASYRRDINGEKVYILMFGVRYMDVARALCGAYNTSDVNAWYRAEDACMAIYEQAQRDGKAKWEEKKAAWKAKANEKKAASKREQSGAGSDSAEREQVRPEVNAAKEQAKCYKPEDVAAMLQTMLDGGDLPEEIKKLMKAA